MLTFEFLSNGKHHSRTLQIECAWHNRFMTLPEVTVDCCIDGWVALQIAKKKKTHRVGIDREAQIVIVMG